MAGTVEKTNNAAGFATGASVGAGTITAGTSGGASGTAWDRLIVPGDIGSTNTMEVLASPAVPTLPGGKWYHLQQAAGTTQAMKIYWTKPTARTVWALDWQMHILGNVTTSTVLFRGYSDAVYGASSLAIDVDLNAGRSMFLRNAKTGEAVSGTNSTATLALNTSYQCQLLVDYGALTATLNVYAAGSPTVVLTCNVAFATSNQIQSLSWGLQTANANGNVLITNIREGYGDWLPRSDIANAGPIITTGAAVRRTYQTGTLIDMPWAATDPDTVTSFTATWLSLPDGVTAPTVADKAGAGDTGVGTSRTRTEQFTPTAPGTYVRQMTASDGTTPTTATQTLEIYPAVNTDTTIKQVVKGGFTVVGGGANTNAGAKAALGDASATTALDSITTPTALTGSLQFDPLGPSGVVIYVSANVPAGGTLTRVWKVYKEDHTTQIYTQTESGITGPTTDVPLILDNTALSAVPINSPTDVGRAALWLDWSDTVV